MPLYHGMKDKKVLSSSSPLSSFLSPSSKHPTATADLHPAERGRSAMLREGVIIPQVRRSRRKVRSEVGRDRGESQLAGPVGMCRSVGGCATRHLGVQQHATFSPIYTTFYGLRHQRSVGERTRPVPPLCDLHALSDFYLPWSMLSCFANQMLCRTLRTRGGPRRTPSHASPAKIKKKYE